VGVQPTVQQFRDEAGICLKRIGIGRFGLGGIGYVLSLWHGEISLTVPKIVPKTVVQCDCAGKSMQN